MAEYDLQQNDGGGGGELFSDNQGVALDDHQLNVNGNGGEASGGGGDDDLMEIDDVPVSQEDAWAVIS